MIKAQGKMTSKMERTDGSLQELWRLLGWYWGREERAYGQWLEVGAGIHFVVVFS